MSLALSMSVYMHAHNAGSNVRATAQVSDRASARTEQNCMSNKPLE